MIVPYSNIGLNEEGTASIAVYPNPTEGILHIQTGAAQGKIMIQIFGMNGTLIEESSLIANEERITLDLNAYASGFYQVKVTTTDSVQNVKITKH